MTVHTEHGHRTMPDHESLDTPVEAGLRAAFDMALIVAMIAAPFLLVHMRNDETRQQAATRSSFEVAAQARGVDDPAPPKRTNEVPRSSTGSKP